MLVLGILLIIIWAVIIFVFKMTAWFVYLLLIVGIIAIIARLAGGKGGRGGQQPTA